MTLRRALVTAPLALLVAILAHFLGFGNGHALGGGHGGQLLALGLGGPVFLGLAAFVWLGLTEPDRRRGERALRAFLPGGGQLLACVAVLGAGALAAFSGIEVLEGRVPFSGAVSVVALAGSTAAVALAALCATRWLAGAGALLAGSGVPAPLQTLQPLRLRPAGAPLAHSTYRGRISRGRAPPLLA